MKKIIIFDVDGVITDSWCKKEQIIGDIFHKHALLDKPGVKEILSIGANRILTLERIHELYPIDKVALLEEINLWLRSLENTCIPIEETVSFIKKYHEQYDFFTNTSLPKAKLLNIFERLDLKKYFIELLAYDDGTKCENVQHILKEYSIDPDKALFIDDKQAHLDAVPETWVHTLLFEQDGVGLEEKVNNIFWK